MTAVCYVGSKSLSHVLACIDRSKGRLLDDAAASSSARAQIVSSVMEYWHAHPGVALSILEKLLNYSILTPLSVVDWVLVASASVSGSGNGDSLAQPHVFELVSNTVGKVTSRVRQLHSSPDADDETAAKEAAAMRDMFRTMNDALSSWAAGSKDELMESGDGSSDREALLREWGQRWLHVYQRKAAMEEAFLIDATKSKAAASTEMVTDDA
jgi:nuclear cap-binding protein subunit 1